MGGKGSGGIRPGSGRKPKDQATAFLHGAKPRQSSSVSAELVPIPADLPAEQRQVWLELAPHAREARTLTSGTAQSFRDLCEAIVLKRAMLSQLEKDGLTYLKSMVDGAGQEHTEVKAHPLISQHRGMMQRVEAGMLRFRLSPVGKEMPATEKPDDPFAEFDGDTVQ